MNKTDLESSTNAQASTRTVHFSVGNDLTEKNVDSLEKEGNTSFNAKSWRFFIFCFFLDYFS